MKHALVGGGIVGLAVFIWFMTGPAPYPDCRLIHESGLNIPVTSCRFLGEEVGPNPSEDWLKVLDVITALIGLAVATVTAGIGAFVFGRFIKSEGLRRMLFGERGED